MQSQNNKKGIATILIITIVSILSIGIAGGGVWYWQSQKIKKQETENNKKIEELQKEIEALKTTPTPINQTSNEVADNIFDINTAKPGEKYGAFTLKSIQAFSEKYKYDVALPFSVSNLTADFTGEATVEVDYTYRAPGEPGMFGEFIKFDITKTDSLRLIPQPKGGSDNVWFGLSDDNQLSMVKNALGLGDKGARGKTKIVIKDYTVNRYPSEVFDTATFVRVVQ